MVERHTEAAFNLNVHTSATLAKEAGQSSHGLVSWQGCDMLRRPPWCSLCGWAVMVHVHKCCCFTDVLPLIIITLPLC